MTESSHPENPQATLEMPAPIVISITDAIKTLRVLARLRSHDDLADSGWDAEKIFDLCERALALADTVAAQVGPNGHWKTGESYYRNNLWQDIGSLAARVIPFSDSKSPSAQRMRIIQLEVNRAEGNLAKNYAVWMQDIARNEGALDEPLRQRWNSLLDALLPLETGTDRSLEQIKPLFRCADNIVQGLNEKHVPALHARAVLSCTLLANHPVAAQEWGWNPTQWLANAYVLRAALSNPQQEVLDKLLDVTFPDTMPENVEQRQAVKNRACEFWNEAERNTNQTNEAERWALLRLRIRARLVALEAQVRDGEFYQAGRSAAEIMANEEILSKGQRHRLGKAVGKLFPTLEGTGSLPAEDRKNVENATSGFIDVERAKGNPLHPIVVRLQFEAQDPLMKNPENLLALGKLGPHMNMCREDALRHTIPTQLPEDTEKLRALAAHLEQNVMGAACRHKRWDLAIDAGLSAAEIYCQLPETDTQKDAKIYCVLGLLKGIVQNGGTEQALRLEQLEIKQAADVSARLLRASQALGTQVEGRMAQAADGRYLASALTIVAQAVQRLKELHQQHYPDGKQPEGMSNA